MRGWGASCLVSLGWAAVLALSAGCGDGGGTCPEPTIAMDVEVTTTIPFDSPSPVSDAELCIEDPGTCGCGRTNEMGFASLLGPGDAEMLMSIRKDGFIPTITQQATGQMDITFATRVIRPEEFDLVLNVAGEERDPDLGHQGVLLVPRPGGTVSGATFTLHALDGGQTYEALYFRDVVPDPNVSSTDDDGTGVFVNVPPGRYEVRSDSFSQCGQVQSGLPRTDAMGNLRGLEVEVRAGAINGVSLVQCDLTP